MFNEEQRKEVLKIVKDEFHDTKIDYVFYIAFCILVLIGVFYVGYIFKHNSDVDYHNEKLQFCKEIYNSDHVVLEKCKDYFVILGGNND